MAQSGAQLSSLTALEHGLPSIFEVIAQGSLISTLKPALKHVFWVMAQNNPQRFGSFYRYSDELYSGLQLILENYYLKHYSASFSENFYGLKRVSLNKSKNVGARNTDKEEQIKSSDMTTQRLSNSEHYRSLIFLVLVPYIKNKCDLLYERLLSTRQNRTPSHPQETMKQRLSRAFMAIYPVVHLLWQGTFLAYQLAYVFGKSLHHSPFLRWASVLLLNLTSEDLEAFSVMPNTLSLIQLFKDKRWRKLLVAVASKVVSTMSLVMSTGLSVGIFFLQFLDWWYGRDHAATSLLALPKPDCPKQHELTNVPKVVTICPLCNRVRTNDTVLAITGYVFCYPCIFRYVQQKGCCPATGYPATTDHLVKLFVSEV